MKTVATGAGNTCAYREKDCISHGLARQVQTTRRTGAAGLGGAGTDAGKSTLAKAPAWPLPRAAAQGGLPPFGRAPLRASARERKHQPDWTGQGKGGGADKPRDCRAAAGPSAPNRRHAPAANPPGAPALPAAAIPARGLPVPWRLPPGLRSAAPACLHALRPPHGRGAQGAAQ